MNCKPTVVRQAQAYRLLFVGLETASGRDATTSRVHELRAQPEPRFIATVWVISRRARRWLHDSCDEKMLRRCGRCEWVGKVKRCLLPLCAIVPPRLGWAVCCA